MSEIKLSGTLPKGEANGLGPIVPGLVDDPARPRVVLLILDCKSITTNADTGEIVPTARIRRLESILDEDLPAAQRLMERALEQRTGRTMLPLGMEDELRAAFETYEVGARGAS